MTREAAGKLGRVGVGARGEEGAQGLRGTRAERVGEKRWKNTTKKRHASQLNVIASFGPLQDNRNYIVIVTTPRVKVDFRM